jgi:hypothetical protein
MSSNPYENEPGFENAKSSEDKKNMAHYVAKVVHSLDGHSQLGERKRLIGARFNMRPCGLP